MREYRKCLVHAFDTWLIFGMPCILFLCTSRKQLKSLKYLPISVSLLLTACHGPAPNPDVSTWSKALEQCDSETPNRITEMLRPGNDSEIFKSDDLISREIINHNCESMRSKKWKELGTIRGYANYIEIDLCKDGYYCGDPRLKKLYLFNGVTFPWNTFEERE